MKRTTKKKLICALQALCLGGGLLAADPAAVCEAATITTSQTYSNQNRTISDDIDITDGYLSISGYNGRYTANLTGQNIYINQGNSAYALLARGVAGGCANGQGILKINESDTSNSTVRIIGNIETAQDGCSSGQIYLRLTNADSFLAGMPIQGGGTIDLRFNNGATWYIPESVNTFVGTNDGGTAVSAVGGNIDIYHTLPGTVRSAAAGTRTFNATGGSNTYETTLALNGATFVLSSDIENNKTDKIELTNVKGNPDMTGPGQGWTNNYAIQIVYDPAMRADGTYTASDLTILTTDNTGDTVTAKDYTTTRTEAAGLKTVNIKLTPTLSTTGGVTKLTALTVKNTDTDGPAAVMAGTSAAAQLAALGAWRAENNDLQRRLGDLRWDEGNAGAWARAYGGESEIHSGAGADVSYHGLQVGYDRARTLGGGKLFTGFALSNMKADASGSAGKSDLDSKLFGVYGSYLGKRGHFLDAIIKYGRFTNDTTRTYDGVNYAGDYDTNGLNMSLEYGYHKKLANGYYLEPQAELNYSHLNSSSYTMTAGGTAGAFVRNNAVDSLIGRIGVNAGRNTKDGNVYLKLSCLHEFNGDTGMTASYNGTTASRSSSGSDTWLEYGVGFNQRIANNQNLYGEITRTAGADKISDSWKANLGWRKSF